MCSAHIFSIYIVICKRLQAFVIGYNIGAVFSFCQMYKAPFIHAIPIGVFYQYDLENVRVKYSR